MYAIRSYYVIFFARSGLALNVSPPNPQHSVSSPEADSSSMPAPAHRTRRLTASMVLRSSRLVQGSRITSYNVCYTKLLRSLSLFSSTTGTWAVPLDIRVMTRALLPLFSIPAMVSNRITSYNVCYTKLLRELKALILETSDANLIKEAAVRKGMKTLRSDGLNKVAQGITSLREVLRVTHE